METREEAKIQAAKNTAMKLSDGGLAIKYFPAEKGFLEGVEWADEHPKNPWRDAKKDPPKYGEWFVAITDLTKGLKVPVVGRIGIDIFLQAFKRRYQYWMPLPETPEGGNNEG